MKEENMWEKEIPIKDDYPDDLKQLIRDLNNFEPQSDDEYDDAFYKALDEWNKEQAMLYGEPIEEESRYDDDGEKEKRRRYEEMREEEERAAERKRQADYEYMLYYLW